MATDGPARPFASRLARQLVIPLLSSLAVAALAAFDAAGCLADTGVARTAEKKLKQASPKRKVGASSGFGIRKDPINKRKDFHKGIDISRPAGTEVFSWSRGVVLKAGWMGDYGYAVDVLHAGGVKTRYAHLLAVHVREGQELLAGETLGQVGRTGRTTGANLHFEVTVEGRLVDPRDHLRDSARIVSRRGNPDG